MIFNHIKKLKADGKKIGITFSTFDMLHAGHIAMLSEAKNHCDYLICGLQTDPTIDRPDTKNRPIQSIVERQIQLAACRYVDEVVVYQTEQDLIDLFCHLMCVFWGSSMPKKSLLGSGKVNRVALRLCSTVVIIRSRARAYVNVWQQPKHLKR